ncbi:MAG: WD40 repeat protein [Bacteroidia bacterium]|jgi:WD40 repeat protein
MGIFEVMQKGVAFLILIVGIIIFNNELAGAQNNETFTTLGTHSDDVESVAVSGNGQYVATGSWDNTVQIFKGDSTFPYFQTLTGHRAAVSALGFSGTGDVLVTGGNDFKLMVWSKVDKKRFELEKELSNVHTAGINSIVVGPSGNMIYSAGDDGKIVIHNQRSNSKWVIDNKIPTNCIALKGRSYILCADESAVVKLYDINGNKLKEYKGHKDVVNAVACNGQYVLTGSSDKTAVIWDAFSGKQKNVLLGHQWKINSVAISADGKYAITGSSDGMTKIWDITTGEEVKSYAEANGKVRQVTMSKDMRYIFSAYQVDSIGQNPTYGLSVWHTGMSFAFSNSEMAMRLKRLEKQRTMRKSFEKQRTLRKSYGAGSGTKPEPKPNPEPEKIELKGEVITDTDEIQITIEDE